MAGLDSDVAFEGVTWKLINAPGRAGYLNVVKRDQLGLKDDTTSLPSAVVSILSVSRPTKPMKRNSQPQTVSTITVEVAIYGSGNSYVKLADAARFATVALSGGWEVPQGKIIACVKVGDRPTADNSEPNQPKKVYRLFFEVDATDTVVI